MKQVILYIIGITLFIGYYCISKYTGFYIPCIFHELTGLYCPGCGITRMFFSIIRLDFYQAFRYNPLVFILLILYLLFKIFKVKLPKNSIYILLIIVILYGIFRNIDLFSYLKPTSL